MINNKNIVLVFEAVVAYLARESWQLWLAVLAFANKHSTISTSLLSLQKTYSVSKSVIWFYGA